MRKHTLTRIISYLVLLCIMLCLVCIYGFKTNASDFKDDYSERKISSNVDLNSEFDTKSVIVVLKPSQSQYRGINTNVIRKLYSIDGVESLEELANVSDDLLVDDKTLKSIDSEIIRHLKEIDYKQIIKIVLNTNTKEKVIDVVHKIELFDEDSYDLIIDPSNCDWGVYDTFLGFFAVSPWNTMYTEPENMRTLGETNPSISLIDLDDIGDLEIGMSYYEVIQTLGSTGLDIGSGTIIQQYETTSGNIVLINYHLVNGEYVVVSIDIE